MSGAGLFEGSPLGICKVSKEGCILKTNSVFRHMVEREVSGETLVEVLPNLNQKSPQRTSIPRATGEPLEVEVSWSPDEGEGFLVFFRDVSEEAQLQLDLTRIADELEQFAYIASHDLREPLIAVAGYASLLKRRCLNRHDGCNECLDKIAGSTKHMERKIDDLLAFSRAGRTPITGTFPLGTALEEAKRALVQQITETQAEIWVLNGGLPVVRGNRSMIAQVFQNLISNALKYRKSSVVPKIEIEARQQGGMVEVRVSDNGIGFDMKYHNRIFVIFQRLHTVENYPGTGMGLSIAKRIVERHGGHIEADSSPRNGATFLFSLPCAED